MKACLMFFRGSRVLGDRFYRFVIDKERSVGSVYDEGSSPIAAGTFKGAWDMMEAFAESASQYFSVNPAEVCRYAFDLGAKVKYGWENTYFKLDDSMMRKLKERYGNQIKLRHMKNERRV